jgi:hypothetical protein
MCAGLVARRGQRCPPNIQPTLDKSNRVAVPYVWCGARERERPGASPRPAALDTQKRAARRFVRRVVGALAGAVRSLACRE